MDHSSPKPKMHLVIGKIYADWCGYCNEMAPAWKEMKVQIKTDMDLVEDNAAITPLKSHKKYVSKDGTKVVEIIEIESESIEDEMPYLQSLYSPAIQSSGFPTLFKVLDNTVSYYGGERTVEKMKQWYIQPAMMTRVRKTRRHRRRRNKTRKNKTRGRYTRSRK